MTMAPTRSQSLRAAARLAAGGQWAVANESFSQRKQRPALARRAGAKSTCLAAVDTRMRPAPRNLYRGGTASTVEYGRMTDAPESRATGDLSVLEAWRLLARPAPTRRATSYAGLLALIALLNLNAIAVIVAASVPDPSLAVVAVLLSTAIIPGALLAFAL